LTLVSQTELVRCLKTSKNDTYSKIVTRVRKHDLKERSKRVERKVAALIEEKRALVAKRDALLETIEIEMVFLSFSFILYSLIFNIIHPSFFPLEKAQRNNSTNEAAHHGFIPRGFKDHFRALARQCEWLLSTTIGKTYHLGKAKGWHFA
jgi:hypothetical protein